MRRLILALRLRFSLNYSWRIAWFMARRP